MTAALVLVLLLAVANYSTALEVTSLPPLVASDEAQDSAENAEASEPIDESVYSMPTVLTCPSSHRFRITADADKQTRVMLVRVKPRHYVDDVPEQVSETVNEDGQVVINIDRSVTLVAETKTPVAILFDGMITALPEEPSGEHVHSGQTERLLTFVVPQTLPESYRIADDDEYFALFVAQNGGQQYVHRDPIKSFDCETPVCDFATAWMERCGTDDPADVSCGCLHAQYDEAMRTESCADVGSDKLAAIAAAANAAQCAVAQCASGFGACVPADLCTADSFAARPVPSIYGEIVCRGHSGVCCRLEERSLLTADTSLSQLLSLENNGYVRADGSLDSFRRESAPAAALAASATLAVAAVAVALF